jgi:hypothetical protein
MSRRVGREVGPAPSILPTNFSRVGPADPTAPPPLLPTSADWQLMEADYSEADYPDLETRMDPRLTPTR